MTNPINMVDVSSKPIIKRIATAEGTIILKPSTIKIIKDGQIKKGDPIAVSRIAAITAIKLTPQIIPLCHQIPITNIDIETELGEDRIIVRISVTTLAQTGVEMEAIMGVSIFLNNVWDMTKYLEKDDAGQYPSTRILEIKVLNKEKIHI